MNYYDTFIQVAPDCPVRSSVVPAAKGDRKTIPVIQYELLAEHPYTYTQEDLQFEVYVRHKSIPTDDLPARRAEFFQKSQPCLRSSPLAKQYGWGLHFNAEGKIALYPVESEEYRQFTHPDNERPQVLTAFRNKRG